MEQIKKIKPAKKEKKWTRSVFKRPPLTMTVGPMDDMVEYSDYLIGYYPERFHKGEKVEDLRYRLLRFERGATKIYTRWYCPVTMQTVEPPESWLPITEYDGDR